MEEQVERRIAELRQQYETGQQQLAELERQQMTLRETLLRISGAIQVLDELQAGQQAVVLHRPEPANAMNHA